MSSFRYVLLAGLALVCSQSAARAQTLEAQCLARQRQVQQRVREMAEQLVGSVLDVQLQQLEENGLTHLELYGDIQTMRGNLDVLVGSAMPEVIQQLSELEAAQPDERRASFVAARKMSREIVVRLIVERQMLLKRLKIAEMAAQVRQLIKLETDALVATELLPEQPASRRESLNLATLEDQRDVRALYGRFVETLKDVSGWTGLFGAEAAGGLRLLHQSRVDQELVKAETSLQSAAFADAATAQKAAIRGLQALLMRIERAQGLMNNETAAAADEICEMIGRQEQLQEATRQSTPEQVDDDELIEEQREIRDDISRLADAMQQSPDVEQALDRAKQSADQARSEMFDQQRDEALADQQRVVDQLEKAAQELAESASDTAEGLTAEEYSERIEDLEAARKDLEKVEAHQQQASDQAEENPAAAQQQERAAEQQLANIPEGRDLTPPVESRLDEAREATHEAAAQMGRPPEPRREAVRQADEALQRAVSETEAALADAQREQLLTEIQEMAHAAHALDRATQEERQIAAEASQAAGAKGVEQKKAQDLAERQSDVEQVAEKVGQGVENTAPEAAKTLQQAQKPLKAAGEQIAKAQEQPGEPSKSAAEQAAEQAAQAADLLEQAAADIRKQLEQTAEQMGDVAGEQIEQVQEARQAVENQLAQAAEQGMQQALGEAVGSLAEREQGIAEDLAEAMAMAAAGMQQAAQPGGQPAGEPLPGGEPSAEQMAGLPDSPGGQMPGQPGGEPAGQSTGQPGEPSGQPGEEPGQPSGEPGQPGSMPAPGGMPMPGGMSLPGAGQLANVPIREAAQLAAEMAGMPAGGMPGMPAAPGMPGIPMAGMPAPGSMPVASQQSNPTPGGGGVSKMGSFVENQVPVEMGLTPSQEESGEGTATPDSDKDAEPAERQFVDEPWFAKLPPELRNAIRNNARRRPPRGYEERLQRYFESME